MAGVRNREGKEGNTQQKNGVSSSLYKGRLHSSPECTQQKAVFPLVCGSHCTKCPTHPPHIGMNKSSDLWWVNLALHLDVVLSMGQGHNSPKTTNIGGTFNTEGSLKRWITHAHSGSRSTRVIMSLPVPVDVWRGSRANFFWSQLGEHFSSKCHIFFYF